MDKRKYFEEIYFILFLVLQRNNLIGKQELTNEVNKLIIDKIK